MTDEKIHQPRTLEQAAALAERYADISFKIGAIEAVRSSAIAKANAAADEELAPLLEQRDAIAGKIAPWWAKAADTLTDGKRKSIELGGCMIGTRTGKASLLIAGEEKDVIDLLKSLRWAKPFLRVRRTLDKVALLKATDGPRSQALAEIGIEKADGEELFFIDAVQQGGALGGQ